MKRLMLILLAICLGACQRQEVPSEATAPTDDTSATPAWHTASANSPIKLTVTPSRLTQCDPAVEADVEWDASATPTITTIEIWASDGSEFKLFAAGGAKGKARTGPWTRPGSRFRVLDSSKKKVLAELQVSGPQC